MAGEPDTPDKGPVPSTLLPGDANLPWAQRIRYAMRVMLYYLPKRLP